MLYGSALKYVLKSYDAFLNKEKSPIASSQVILNSRTKNKNAPLVSSTVTAMFRKGSPDFRHLTEAPAFGHSDVHVGLQIADNHEESTEDTGATSTYRSVIFITNRQNVKQTLTALTW